MGSNRSGQERAGGGVAECRHEASQTRKRKNEEEEGGHEERKDDGWTEVTGGGRRDDAQLPESEDGKRGPEVLIIGDTAVLEGKLLGVDGVAQSELRIKQFEENRLRERRVSRQQERDRRAARREVQVARAGRK